MSFEKTVYTGTDGAIIFFSGCVGRWFEVFDPSGTQIGTAATLTAAKALLTNRRNHHALPKM